jgi:uncharacterized protein (TIGR02391 family)
MSRSRSASQPTPSNLSLRQIRAAIPRLEARITDLKALLGRSIPLADDPQLSTVKHKLTATVAQIFNPDTLEYKSLTDLFTRTTIASGFGVLLPHEIKADLDEAIAILTCQVALMKEQLGEDGDSTTDRAIRAYTNLDLHSEIARAASELYRGGHYANAIEDAVKALNAWVRYRSGETLDGTALMEKVFSPKNPVLRFNDLKDQSDQDEQRGFMMLFSGAIVALRNPRAHKLIEDEAGRALELIAFVSLLAKLLDGAKKVPSP